MGISLDLVLSDERHYGEFVCKICMTLAEDALHTCCAHVFCRACLEEWIEHQQATGGTRRCPSCNTNLIDDSLQPLKQASPLAARILGRVTCACPLKAQGCGFVGDYSELHSHLTNSQSHVGMRSKQQSQVRTPTARPLFEPRRGCSFIGSN